MKHKHFPAFMAVLILAWALSLLAANMVRCNKWVGTNDVRGNLCTEHGFGNKADNCAVCGNWVGSVKGRTGSYSHV